MKNTQQSICALICQNDGIKARDIAKKLDLDHKTVNQALYTSPLMKELCWQDREYRWHGIVRQARPHLGLQEFAGYYSRVDEFLDLSEEEWLSRLMEGCTNIGRNLNDTRGLFHSFHDCREQMRRIFDDMVEMAGDEEDELEILNGVSTDRVSHNCRVHRPGFPRLACPQNGIPYDSSTLIHRG